MGPRTFLICAVTLIVAGCSSGEKPTQISTSALETKAASSLEVRCSSFQNGGTIPETSTGYGKGLIPDLTWSKPPDATKSLVVLAEDPDAPGSTPFVHWLIVDIPPSAKSAPGRGRVLANSDGQNDYYPPKPPPGKRHHYHYEVYALDLPTVAAQDREGVLTAMKGHVLAKGELVATYEKTG